MGAKPAQPGKGFFGWLGRQVGYVKKAVQTDFEAEKKIFEEKRVEEAPHPENPNIKLRRTVIDQAIQKPDKITKSGTGRDNP
jgi:hypothetical protein